MHTLAIHSILNHTLVNGPGDRLAIWTQGCTKGCKGCFNPHTWKFEGGEEWVPKKLAEYVRALEPEGLTLTGGDPLEQSEALLEFLKALHDEGNVLNILPRGIICFTGYVMEEIEKIESAKACLEYIDLLIDGRFVEELKYENGLAGSSNQRFHFSSKAGRGKSRIAAEIIDVDQDIEIHFEDEQAVQVTGFPDIDKSVLKELGIKLI